jgi:hypothetical protein
MRRLKLALVLATAIVSTHNINAQVMITESFKVTLECKNDQCKKQIETSMTKHGAKNAEWDSDTKTITVTYDPRKAAVSDIRKQIEMVISENGGTASTNTPQAITGSK